MSNEPQPEVRRCVVTDVPAALDALRTAYVLPDGEQLTHPQSVRKYERQIAAGYFMRIEFPPSWSREQCIAWYDNARFVLEAHRLGAL